MSSPAFVREPEGNGVAERFIGTLKEPLLWVLTFDTVEELRLLEFKERDNTPGSANATGIRLSRECARAHGA